MPESLITNDQLYISQLIPVSPQFQQFGLDLLNCP